MPVSKYETTLIGKEDKKEPTIFKVESVLAQSAMRISKEPWGQLSLMLSSNWKRRSSEFFVAMTKETRVIRAKQTKEEKGERK